MDFDPKSSAPVSLTQFFPLQAETVFNAWIDPAIMRQWLFRSPANEILKIDLDLQVGGRFSILEWTGTQEIDHFGEFQKIEPPHNLAFTLQVPKHFPDVTSVTVGFASTPDGCVMNFQQTGVAKKVTEKNWRVMFATLADLLTQK